MKPSFDPLVEYLNIEIPEGVCEAQRLFHGRGGVYPGWETITVDSYYPVLLVTFYREEDPEWFASLGEVLSIWASQRGFESLLFQYRCRDRAPSECIWGRPVSAPYPVQEAGLKYRVWPGQAQNPGLFLDMAMGRSWIRQHAAGCRVLNTFAYTCSLSVAALAGGAARVVNIDMNGCLLETGRENHRLNGQDEARVEYYAHNLLKSWGRVRRQGPYDLVIFDPPTRQRGSFEAERDYGKLIRRVPELMPAGGILFAALNAPHLSFQFLQDQVEGTLGHAVTLVERLTAPRVFAESNQDAGLKVGIWRISV
ncbi:MAG: class I SAM-dependent methyltransferase [Planctomycetota bacterium]|jgi:23S rRNA (cytosine1962-C5)-methyltransferase